MVLDKGRNATGRQQTAWAFKMHTYIISLCVFCCRTFVIVFINVHQSLKLSRNFVGFVNFQSLKHSRNFVIGFVNVHQSFKVCQMVWPWNEHSQLSDNKETCIYGHSTHCSFEIHLIIISLKFREQTNCNNCWRTRGNPHSHSYQMRLVPVRRQCLTHLVHLSSTQTFSTADTRSRHNVFPKSDRGAQWICGSPE